MLRRGHRELERRLEVGLLEHREHAAGVGNLELAVEVDLVVDRVDEAVQALSGVRVDQSASTIELVLGLQVVERDARTPSLTTAGSRLVPLRVTECTVRVIASMNVETPGRRA